MGELPDGEWVVDDPPKRGGHAEWWMSLTPFQRVLHYNRNLPRGCTHEADFYAWPELLREAWSFDPYAHVAHMDEHQANSSECACQMCICKFGIPRDTETRKVSAVAVCELMNGEICTHERHRQQEAKS